MRGGLSRVPALAGLLPFHAPAFLVAFALVFPVAVALASRWPSRWLSWWSFVPAFLGAFRAGFPDGLRAGFLPGAGRGRRALSTGPDFKDRPARCCGALPRQSRLDRAGRGWRRARWARNRRVGGRMLGLVVQGSLGSSAHGGNPPIRRVDGRLRLRVGEPRVEARLRSMIGFVSEVGLRLAAGGWLGVDQPLVDPREVGQQQADRQPRVRGSAGIGELAVSRPSGGGCGVVTPAGHLAWSGGAATDRVAGSIHRAARSIYGVAGSIHRVAR